MVVSCLVGYWRVVSWDRVTQSHWLQVSGKPQPCAASGPTRPFRLGPEPPGPARNLPRDGPEPVTGFSAAIKEPPG